MLFTFFSVNNFLKCFLLFFFFICFLLIIFNEPFGFFRSDELDNVDTSSEIILARLSRAMAELTALKAQNEELRELIQNFFPLESNPFDKAPLNAFGEHRTPANGTLDSEFEFSRRKLGNDLKELWNYVRVNSKPENREWIREIKNSLSYDLSVIDKHDESLRRKELRRLSSYVQKKIKGLQNPVDCKNARKFVCTLDKGCGFGCQIHHLSYCMIMALGANRTLVLNSKTWRYAKTSRGSQSLWDLAFQPLSQTCLDESGSPRVSWLESGPSDYAQVIDLPILDSLRPRPNFLPLAVPEQFATDLSTVHGAPFVWFMGQIINYLMRPSKQIKEYVEEKKNEFGLQNPIVGVHVRRTDKINTEAAYHSLSEYMVHVEDYFDKLDLFRKRQTDETPIERLVYLATDDVSVWKKEISVYESKGYKFIGDSEISDTASVRRRYSFESLKNVILDVWLLSETDYLVCTFSSQTCRLAYELMQAKNPNVDKSGDFFSLDDIYYFGGQNGHNQVSVLDHKAKDDKEIDIKRGDIIGIAGNHWNGYSKGINRVSMKMGLYPGFKTKEKIDTANFELFQDYKKPSKD